MPEVAVEENCIDCGHCVAICPKHALSHASIDSEQCIPVNSGNISADNMEIFLRSRRSVRAYKRKPIEKETLS